MLQERPVVCLVKNFGKSLETLKAQRYLQMLGKTNNLLGPHANWVVNKARSFNRTGSGFRLFIEIFFP